MSACYQRNRDEVSAKRKAYRQANLEAVRAQDREQSRRNPEAARQRARAWNAKNPERLLERVRQWRADNPEQTAAQKAKYKASRRRGTPPWVNAEDFRPIYAERIRLTKETGIPHHVDHIVPLQGEIVSGLHVPWNLQVLPATENVRKHNRFTP